LLKQREQFTSRLGFVLAAAGSAVGLGNIWGFPTNTANGGGAAFVLIYLVLAFTLAYPALMAELTIGRHTRANIVTALQGLSPRPGVRLTGRLVGSYGILVASLILCFYSLVAGWMAANLASSGAALAGLDRPAAWLARDGVPRNLLFAGLFSLITAGVVSEGVKHGIERWSSRLMPTLVALLVALIGYVLTRDGAIAGLTVYLLPDFARISSTLVISALGQAFFSLSLGVGTMLVYGSYIREGDSLPATGAIVTLVDIGVAFLAGLLIIPAMFAGRELGVEIYANGQLQAGPDLIFRVLPALFDSMGPLGNGVATAFFALMTIAALTSSISMLEVPVALATETTSLNRKTAAWLVGGIIFAGTATIAVFFDPLFGAVVTLTTEFSQPLLGIALCLFAGWAFNRNALLEEIRAGNPGAQKTLFWKVWPTYVRYFCPLLIATVFVQAIFL
jgi:NSS family neurotransmitter:Na+ symporter